MLRIRPEQMEAFFSRPRDRDLQRIAAGLRALKIFDAGDAGHLAQIGAEAGDDEPKIDGRLQRFLAEKRAEAAAYGITAEYLLMHYAGFSFRYGSDWTSVEGITAILDDATLDAAGRMEGIRARLLEARSRR